MWKPILVKLCLFVLGVVVGGAVVFGIIKLTGSSSNSGNAASNSTGTRVNDSLKYVIAVSRHGNRGTYEDYPLDPYPMNSTEYWPYGVGQLTPYGRVQEYNLGAKLRTMYNGFLNATFYTEDIFACTDLYDRTMMSGELVMAGLFPPVGWQVWNQNVNWQPVPLFTNSSDHTKVINWCAKYQADKDITFNKFEKDYAANISQFSKYVYDYTNENVTMDDLSYMFEKLLSEETEGYTLPNWTSSIFPDPLAELYGESFIASCAGTDDIVGLWIGSFLGEMVDTLNGVVNGSVTRRLSYYSAHDASLLNLQVGFGVPRSSVINVIKTGSAVVLELHQDPDNSQFYVQVLFIDGSSLDSDPISLTLSACGDPCYFDIFANSTKTYTSVSYEEECDVDGS